MFDLRPYQNAAVASVLNYWRSGGGNPLVEMATGTGKSLVVAALVRALAEHDHETRILMLVHVRELVAQNAAALLRHWPAAPLGINSAGLGRRDTHAQIVFASIQSVARDHGAALGKRHVILIDESHLVPHDGDGQYRAVIECMQGLVPDMRVAGFTATPFRLGSGLSYGKGSLFDKLTYSYGIGEGVDGGYLAPLTCRLGASEIDVRGVAKRGGEFVPALLEAAARKPSVIVATCRDAVSRLQDRKAWLFFCSGVLHAEEVAGQLQGMGVDAACVTGQTPSAERDRILQAFKSGKIRALTNANVLTTGFDAPIVDAIVMMRPTLSTGLYVQMLGRGTRTAPGKSNCLVLDYSGNVRRHGPVDAIEVRGRKGAGQTEVGTIRAKECPGCGSLVAIATMTCKDCGHEWKRKAAEIEKTPDHDAAVMARELEQRWLKCSSVDMFRHAKPGGVIYSARVEYRVGMTTYKEWVTPDHPALAGARGRMWWQKMTNADRNVNVDGMIVLWPALRPESIEIQIKRDGKYWRIVNRRFVRGGLVIEVDERLKSRVIGHVGESGETRPLLHA